jgi:thiamine-phosphate pyrophosphorylase
MLLYWISDGTAGSDRTLNAADDGLAGAEQGGLRGAAQTKSLLDDIAEAAAAGVDSIQLREKHLSGRELFDLARAATAKLQTIAPSRGGTRVRLLINDRADIAAAAGCAGVHLPADGLPTAEVRRKWPALLVARSCHSVNEVVESARAGADFCVLGPIFATPSKTPERGYLGPSIFGDVAAALRGWADDFPVMAIGGISEERAQECRGAGAAGIAAIRLFQGPNRAVTIQRLKRL